MKLTHTLAGCIAMLAAGPAISAVSLSSEGSGQGLLFPYATIEQGLTTHLAIDNTSDRAKAVKYHVRESREGHIVAAGTAYIPAHGRWTVALQEEHRQGFITLQFGGGVCMARAGGERAHLRHHEFPDGQPAGVDFWPIATVTFDAVEMGELDEALTKDVAEDCSKIWSRWHVAGNARGAWARDPGEGILPPTGGLRGSALLVDTESGTSTQYPALAFAGLASTPRHAVLHFQTPYLTDVEAGADGYVRVDLPSGDQLRFREERGVDALAALLAAGTAATEFAVDGATRPRTDIIVSLPFRHAYVGGVIDEPFNDESLNHPPRLLAPFTAPACEDIAVTARDVAGAEQASSVVPVCGIATVLKVRPADGGVREDVAADERATPLMLHGSGSVELRFGAAEAARVSRADEEARCWQGLPAWVMSMTALDNIKAPPGGRRTYIRSQVAAPSYQSATCLPRGAD